MKRLVIGLSMTLGTGMLLLQPAPETWAAAPDSVRQGVQLFNKGYVQKAIPLFEKAVSAHPADESANLWLARALKKQGGERNLARATQAYQAVLNANPNNKEALLALGEVWSWNPATRDEAVSLLKRAYEVDPADPKAGKLLSEVLYWQGQSVDALQYAAPVADTYANDKAWLATYAQILTRTGNTARALPIFEGPLNVAHSQNAAVRQSYVLALFKTGKRDAALTAYGQLKALATEKGWTNNPEFLSGMSGLAFEMGEYAESVQWDGMLPDANQRHKDVQLRMARAYAKSYRVPEAIEKFRRLDETGLLTSAEKLEYADYLTSLNLPPESLPSPDAIDRLYQGILTADPHNAEILLRMARMSAKNPNRFNETVQYYQQAMAVDPRAEKELVDFLKSVAKGQTEQVAAVFDALLKAHPDSPAIKGGYAEFLSWQPARRVEAMRLFLQLAQADAGNKDYWQQRLEQVLEWHEPATELIPLYQEVVNVFPESRTVWLTVARAYRNNPEYYVEAVETYQTLLGRFPDDHAIKEEWLALLLGNQKHRVEALKTLRAASEQNPSDLEVSAAYGKLLSYERRYGEAMDVFERVLAADANQKDALVGKGYVMLWSGQKLKAKTYLEDLRQRFPDDVDVALALAQAEKLIGRYDRALRIMEEIKPLINQYYERRYGLQLCDYQAPEGSLYGASVYDFSILPYASPEAEPQAPVVKPSSDVTALQSDVHSLNQAIQTLDQLQNASKTQLDSMHAAVDAEREQGLLSEVSINASVAEEPSQASAAMAGSLDTGEMTPNLGLYSALDYDTNPLLSGLGRLRNDDLADLQQGLVNDLRPMLRAGYLYSTQQGERTTTSFRNWGFPNQVALSLTPQLRLRGGIRPTKFYIPDGVDPRVNWGTEYAFGATAKYWDRLTLNGDMAITHFSQTKDINITYDANAQYDFNDSIRLRVGSLRRPLYNSLLAVAGQRPDQGAFAGQVLGQAREVGFYGELSTNPFSPNIDWNLGYEWAFVNGHEIPTNYKNQAYTSLGYTWHYASNHKVRAGYEFLYFGYSKNATSGFFDTTAAGVTQPVAGLDPVVLASGGTVFGGYFSPKWFIMNAGRLDFQGSLFNKFVEYKLGGSLGVQAFAVGHGIDDDDVDSPALASSFDANVIFNLTDWLAAYGNVDFLDAGGQFNRWRFGGGLIVRPHIDALSPVIK